MTTPRIRWLAAGVLIAALAATAAAQASAGTRASRHGMTLVPLRIHTADLARLAGRGAAHLASATPASSTYTDATGDGGTAPDLTSVAVQSDANWQITIRINATGLTSPSDVTVLLALDTDENASTGYQGADYLLLVDFSDNSFGFGKWDGSNFVDTPAPTLSVTSDSSGMTVSINASDLAGAHGFNFWVRSLEGSTVSAGHYDDAPDQGFWTYLQLQLMGFLSPKNVKAGKSLTTVMLATRSDTGATVPADAQVQCQAAIGSKPLKLLFSGFVTAQGVSAAGCSWRVPKTAHKKTIRGTETISYQGASVTQTFKTRVK